MIYMKEVKTEFNIKGKKGGKKRKRKGERDYRHS